MSTKQWNWIMYAFAAIFGLALAAIIILSNEARQKVPSKRSKGKIYVAMFLFGVALFVSLLVILSYVMSEFSD
jgi:membrane-associated HD superfamily phosphohydrolase